MQAGYRLTDGGRIDVESVKDGRRVRVELTGSTAGVFTLTVSEARAVASALMGSAAEV
jgi:hypothetical protein